MHEGSKDAAGSRGKGSLWSRDSAAAFWLTKAVSSLGQVIPKGNKASDIQGLHILIALIN